MQALVEKRQLTSRLWWRGATAQVVASLPLALAVGVASSASFLAGGLALLLGNGVSALYAFRVNAPSGSGAMVGVLVGTVLKWMVVAALLGLAMTAPEARIVWVFLGLVFAKVVWVVTVMTFRRR